MKLRVKEEDRLLRVAIVVPALLTVFNDCIDLRLNACVRECFCNDAFNLSLDHHRKTENLFLELVLLAAHPQVTFKALDEVLLLGCVRLKCLLLGQPAFLRNFECLSESCYLLDSQ